MGIRICQVDGCQREYYAKDLCAMHYQRLRYRGTIEDPPKRGASPEQMANVRAARQPPAKAECHRDRKHYAKGLCRACYSTKFFPATNWQKANPERARYHRRGTVLKKHGLTHEQWDGLWEQQGGRCANPRCRRQFTVDFPDHRGGLQVDHDHVTGQVRGLLCKQCNSTLGHAGDNLDRLRGLVEYLESIN